MTIDAAGDVIITDFLDEEDPADVVGFLTEWATGDAAASEAHLADHAEGSGTTLIARRAGKIIGIVTMRWTSNNPTFAENGIPLIHQLSVDSDFRRSGVATALMEAIEQLAWTKGRRTVGITVGLFDEYGPAQRLYAKRGYLPDGRGVCQGRLPLQRGQTIQVDHDIILWLTKAL